jgi:hypothetical protein
VSLIEKVHQQLIECEQSLDGRLAERVLGRLLKHWPLLRMHPVHDVFDLLDV